MWDLHSWCSAEMIKLAVINDRKWPVPPPLNELIHADCVNHLNDKIKATEAMIKNMIQLWSSNMMLVCLAIASHSSLSLWTHLNTLSFNINQCTDPSPLILCRSIQPAGQQSVHSFMYLLIHPTIPLSVYFYSCALTHSSIYPAVPSLFMYSSIHRSAFHHFYHLSIHACSLELQRSI